MRKPMGMILVTVLLAGCGGSGASSGNTSSLGAAFDTSFKSSFRTKFVEQCVAGAKATSPLKVDFAPICACSADKLLATKTPAQLMSGPSNEEIQSVAMQCAREHPPVR